MREVEDTRAGTNGFVLGNVVRVLQGHIPATEIGEGCAQLLVNRVQGGLLGGH